MALPPQIRFLVQDTYDMSARSMSAAMVTASRATTQATARQVEALLDVFARDVASSERQAFFETLGDRAQEAIVKSYRGHRRGPSGYRKDGEGKMRRYAGGEMLKALQDSDLIYEATPRGITFLPDVNQLDRRARQWYRLNFGARPAFGRSAQRFEVSISNVYLFSIGFAGAAPSEPFRIPRGFWVEGGAPVEAGEPGTSAFYPRSEAARIGISSPDDSKAQRDTEGFFPGRRQARGITAEHFLDAGLRRFTQDLSDPGRQGVGLRGLYFRFYERGLATVRPTRPPAVGLGSFRP